MRMAIIGKGNVGKALGTGLKDSGHEIRYGHRDSKEPVKAAAEWGNVIILAVPHPAVKDVVEELGSSSDGKVLIDVTNPLEMNPDETTVPAISAAEEIQKLLPKARVVKAFNTVFARNQSTGKLGKEKLTAFIAGDDQDAKRITMELAKDIGFEPVDCGPLKNARYLESMAALIIALAFDFNMGTKIGYKLVKA